MSRTLPILTLVFLLSPTTASPLTDTGNTSEQWRRYAILANDLQPARSFPYAHCFRQAASAHGLPLTLLLAVARGESDFDAKARSRANALGLMQIRWPRTAKHLGIRQQARLLDPCINVDAGARYLKELQERYNGDLHLTLAAYNYGPGRIAPGTRKLPEGARWYSAYIQRHLQYVLGRGSAGEASGTATAYHKEGRLEIIRFSRPYRAVALVDSLSNKRPKLRLDIFRRPEGHYSVVLLFETKVEKKRGLNRLSVLGLKPV